MANPNPKPPKRKKRSALSLRVRGSNKKRSSFNYNAAREELGVPNANSQQITSAALSSGPNPQAPKGRSPTKREIKAQLAEKDSTINKLEVGVDRMERKVSSLQQTIRDLSRALKDEKEKSRLAMAKLLEDAEAMIDGAINNNADMDRKMSAAELAIERERERVIDERRYSSIVVSTREFIHVHYFIDFMHPF